MQYVYLALTAAFYLIGWLVVRNKDESLGVTIIVRSLWTGFSLFLLNITFSAVVAGILTANSSTQLPEFAPLISQVLGVLASSLLTASAILYIYYSRRARTVGLKKSRVLLYIGFGVLGLVQPLVANRILVAIVLVTGLLLIWLSLSALIAEMAEAKGRSWAAFFWLSVLFSPLIMWIIAAAISPFAGSAAYVAPPQSGNPDSTEQLRKLAELRDEGILTKAEFEAKKKELLDRI